MKVQNEALKETMKIQKLSNENLNKINDSMIAEQG